MISLLVVILAFALFFFLSFRGVNLFLTVFACTTLVCLCTPDGLTSIFTTFLPSTGNMFQQFFLLYTIGGAFGFCLMESGLGDSMATHLIKVFGEKWIAVALFVITCLMMAAGVASYQYAVLAISLPVLKKLNMSRKVALAAMSAGAGSVCYGTLVGMPNALNIAPTTYLGTTTMAGVGISLVCTAFSVAFIVGYLIFLTHRLKAKGEGFEHGAAYSVTGSGAAQTLFQRLSTRRKDTCVWLGENVTAAGMQSLIQQAESSGDRCRALTETAA